MSRIERKSHFSEMAVRESTEDSKRRENLYKKKNSIGIKNSRIKDSSKKNGGIISKSIPSYSATSDLARVASAKTPFQLKMIIAELQGKRKNFKSSGADEATIKSLCKRVDKVMGKAGKKINSLEKEARMKEKAERLRRMQKERAAKRTEEELEKHRKKRKAKEHAQVRDSGDANGALERIGKTGSTSTSVQTNYTSSYGGSYVDCYADTLLTTPVTEAAVTGEGGSVDVSL